MKASVSSEILLQRSRQLKRTEPMPILRGELEDALVVSAALAGLVGMDKDEKREEHIRGAIHGEEIPIPVIETTSGWDELPVAPWHRPDALLAAVEPPESYDLEEDDLMFLQAHNTLWNPSRRAQQTRKAGFEITPEFLEHALQRLEEITGRTPSPGLVISLTGAQDALGEEAPSHVIEAIYGYWYFKRLRLGRALLRVNMPPPAWDDPNPFLTFRPRLDTPIARRRKLREERELQIQGRKLRAQIHGGVELVSLVNQRENMKRSMVRNEEALFDLDVTLARRSQVERDDFAFRLNSGLHDARDENFDPLADVAAYRLLCEDPQFLKRPDPTESWEWLRQGEIAAQTDCKRRRFGLELEHLAYMRVIRLPGVAPFLGVPFLWRSGRVVYSPVSVSELRELKDRLFHEDSLEATLTQRLKVRQQRNPMGRLQLLVEYLKMLGTSSGEGSSLEEEGDEIETFARDDLRLFVDNLGADGALVGRLPHALHSRGFELLPRSLKEKRSMLLSGQ